MSNLSLPSLTTGPLILASSSPYRRELLERLGLPFTVSVPDIDESPIPGELPAITAMRLAEAKARKVAVSSPQALIIGSDQVACCDDQKLGKPGNHATALAQLKMMRDHTVEFHSALCLYDARRDFAQVANVITHVRLRDLPDDELDAYLRLEQPYDVAGSAKAEGLGIALLESVNSKDPTALIGLPLIKLTEMLRTAGVSLFNRSL